MPIILVLSWQRQDYEVEAILGSIVEGLSWLHSKTLSPINSPSYYTFAVEFDTKISSSEDKATDTYFLHCYTYVMETS